MTANTSLSTMSNFNAISKEYYKAQEQMREICLDMLKEICNRREDKTIDLSGLKDYIYDSGDACPTIKYDGGRHPEYATNMYSDIYEFKYDGTFILFDIEDSEDYKDYRVDTEDLIELCEVILAYEQDGYVLGVKEYSDDEE